MAGNVTGASTFQNRITTLTKNDDISDDAGYLVASAVSTVVDELKVELELDSQALVAAQSKLDSFSVGSRIAGVVKGALGVPTAAGAAADKLDAVRGEIDEDHSALRRAEAKVEWFSDLSGNKLEGRAEQISEAERKRAQRRADERLRSECVAGTAESGCGRIAPGFATKKNW